MADKRTHNFIDGIANKLKGKKADSPQSEMRKEQVIVANNRKNAENMISKLRSINLYDKNTKHSRKIAALGKFEDYEENNKLSNEVIASEEFEDVINWAIKELSAPTIFTRDISSLDEELEFSIDALSKAIKEGWITTARWAAISIYQGLSNLRQEISGIDMVNADELYEKRLNYAIEMGNIIRVSQDYDITDQSLQTQKRKYDKAFAKQQEIRKYLKEQKKSDEGSMLLEEIRQNVHNPAALSEKAKALKKELEDYQRLRGNVEEMYVTIMTKESELNECNQKIATIRIHLAELPAVNDPMLEAKIERADKLYVKNLEKTLDDIKISREAHKRYLEKLKHLSTHEVLQDEAAQVIVTMNNMDIEDEKELNRKMMIAERAKKEKEKNIRRMEALKQSRLEYQQLVDREKALEEELEDEKDYEEEVETQAEEDFEDEVETEYEYEPE